MILQNQDLIRSYGRIKSRKLSTEKQNLYEEFIKGYEFNFTDTAFTSSNKPLYLEIGFGFGDFTFEIAKNNQNINLIASETYINGIVSLLQKIKKNPLSNLKIFRSDVRILLNNLPDNIFDRIYILFPDPWPKLKHFKRRLINQEFLDLIKNKMKKTHNSKLIIASDHDSYKEWIMSLMTNNKDFTWKANKEEDWQCFPPDWTHTKYQNKAKLEARESAYLEFNLF